MPDWILVHNPGARAGRQATNRIRESLSGISLPSGVDLQWISLAELPGRSEPAGRIIAIGGDGTVSMAAKWMLERGLDAPLGIVPAGTGNNLARGLAIPLEPAQAFRRALLGTRTRPLDGCVIRDGRGPAMSVMVQSACLGFPAAMAARYEALRGHAILRPFLSLFGPYVYRLLAALGLEGQKRKEKRGEDLLEARCLFPHEELYETVLAVFLGNERSLGGNFHPCPIAQVDDGLLDVCLVRSGTGTNYWELFREVVRGEHLRLDKVVLYRQFSGTLEIELSTPAPILVDGDIRFTSDRFRIEVLPARFQVIVG